MEKLHLRELAESSAALNFLLPSPQKPIFGNNSVEVTRKAADTFAEVFRKIIARGEDRTRAQRYILQLRVSVVAEDLALLPNEIVTTLLAESVGKPADCYDFLRGLTAVWENGYSSFLRFHSSIWTMSFPYPSHHIHEIIQAPKVVREGETFVVSTKGQRGASFDVNLELRNGEFRDLRYLGGTQDVAMPESYKASLLLAAQRVRGVDYLPVGQRRFYKERIPPGWHQNVIDPNLPTDHNAYNRHLPLLDFTPTDFKDFVGLAAELWNIELAREETML